MTLTFAEDNPHAGTWFALLYQGFALAAPGARTTAHLVLERTILQKLEAISTPGQTQLNGFTPRTLDEPCTLPLTDTERHLLIAYLSSATFPPYLSPALLDVLAALASLGPE